MRKVGKKWEEDSALWTVPYDRKPPVAPRGFVWIYYDHNGSWMLETDRQGTKVPADIVFVQTDKGRPVLIVDDDAFYISKREWGTVVLKLLTKARIGVE